MSYRLYKYLSHPGFIVFIISSFAQVLTGLNKNSYYIPLIVKSSNPSLFSGDFFVNSSYVYNSFYFKMLGLLCRYIELTVVISFISFTVAFGMALSIFYLTRILFKSEKIGYLSVLLFITTKNAISLASIGIPMGYEASAFSMPFLLFSLILFFKHYYLAASLIVSFMFYIQGMQAAFVATFFIFYFLFHRKEIEKADIFKSLGGLVLPALPMLCIVLKGGFLSNFTTQEINQWISILHVRSWYHLFPFSWGIGDWYKYMGWFIWGFILFVLYKPEIEKIHQKMIMFFMKVVLFTCVTGTIFSEVWTIPLIIKMVPFRSTIFFVLFILLYMGNYLFDAYENKIGFIIISSVSTASIFLYLPEFITSTSLFFLALEMKKRRHIALFYILTILSVLGSLTLLLFSIIHFELQGNILSKIINFANLGRHNIAMLLSSSIAFMLISFWALQGNEIKKRKLILICGCLLLLSAGFIRFNLKEKNFSTDFNNSWKAVQIWAKENSDIEDIFIVPPYLEGFRIFSQRSVVVEYKDGAAAVYSIPYALKWWERINDFGYKELKTNLKIKNDLKQIYKSLTTEKVLKLAKKYCAKYIIVENEQTLNFEEVYKNKNFKVYLIKN